MEMKIEYDGNDYIVVYDDNGIDHVVDVSTSETLDVAYVGYDNVCNEHHWNVLKDDNPIFGLITAYDENDDIVYDYTYATTVIKEKED